MMHENSEKGTGKVIPVHAMMHTGGVKIQFHSFLTSH